MGTLTVTTKGQVTFRRDILKHLGVEPGDKISVDQLPHGRVEVRAERPAGKISDAFNFLKRPKGKTLSVDQMKKIAARGWAAISRTALSRLKDDGLAQKNLCHSTRKPCGC
jgi:bifunctional DNA-binding transcriptional regulator/antitoxin component of YhaV-PrlF toxin-antitoxin module